MGPKLGPVSDYDYRVTVRDDAGRTVTGAMVQIAGITAAVATARSGRAFVPTAIHGSRTITIDGSHGAATNSSILGSLTVSATLPGDNELDYVVYLPDGATSQVETLATGVALGTEAKVDNSPSGGAILTIGSGDVITSQSASSTVALRTGKLSIGHLPPTLSDSTGTPMITSQGVFVFPLDIEIATGGKLSVPNTDLQLAAGKTAQLYRLDSVTGVWTDVGSGSKAGGSIEAGFGSVRRGGLYCFGVPSTDLTTVRGRLIDEDLLPIFGALVRGPQALAKTLGDGRFAIDVPRKNASQSDRTVTLEVTGGRYHLPVTMSLDPVSLNSADVDTGTSEFQTRYATNIRTLMTHKGYIDESRRLRLSSLQGLTGGGGNGGVSGEVHVQDIAAESVGFLVTRPVDEFLIQRTWGRFYMFAFAVDNAIPVFSTQELWRSSNHGGTVITAVDKFGTGPIFEVHAMWGNDPTRGYLGMTDFNGFLAAAVGLTNDLTLCMETQSDGRKVVSAFTIRGTASGRVEVPIERALRSLGVFRRFGMYEGNLTSSGSTSGDTRQVRASGGLARQDFYDEVFLGSSNNLDAPVQLEQVILPYGAGPHYRLGIPQGLGHLVAVEGDTSGGRLKLLRFGIESGLDVVEGTGAVQDLDLDLTGDTDFLISGGDTNRDGAFTDADMKFDIAAELPTGLVVNIARNAEPNSTPGTPGIALPGLDSWKADFTNYIVGYGASRTFGSDTISQQVFARLDGTTVSHVGQLPVPTISPDTSTPIIGFKVQITAPAAAHYVVLTLRHESSTEIRDWTVVLPSDVTEYTFHQLPSPMPNVLDHGSSNQKVWTLTATCARIDDGPLIRPFITHDEVFYRVQANWVGLKEADRQVAAFSSRSIQVTTTN
ncbi:MAG: hypothetical protein VX951_12920 [Planctomycetota bacterium]|nr:hypothetical protein [Planctomycetota bacterium]